MFVRVHVFVLIITGHNGLLFKSPFFQCQPFFIYRYSLISNLQAFPLIDMASKLIMKSFFDRDEKKINTTTSFHRLRTFISVYLHNCGYVWLRGLLFVLNCITITDNIRYHYNTCLSR